MVTVASTAVTCTFNKSIALDSTFTTTSATYVDVTGMSIPSVPNGAKIYFHMYVTKSTGGTMDLRITDGTNVFYEITGVGTGDQDIGSLDGSYTQNSGGAATVKLQILSSDGNNAAANASVNGMCWFFVTDMSGADPLVYAPSTSTAHGENPIIWNGKRQIDTLYGAKMPKETTENFGVSIAGLQVKETLANVTVKDAESLNLSAITSEISMYPGSPAPVWAEAVTTRGRSAVFITYSGYNVEITG